MILFFILMAVAFFILSIVGVVFTHIKKTERQKYLAAAGNIIREDFLNYSLQNTLDPYGNIEEPKGAKVMIYLKSKSTGKKTSFVFDPEKVVRFGRNGEHSNIYINDVKVSQNHCRIYSENDTVFLQDLGSVNGTYVRRGMVKRYALRDGNQIVLQTGDKIEIGACVFKVCLFYFDLTTM